jgi:hypothetical protein
MAVAAPAFAVAQAATSYAGAAAQNRAGQQFLSNAADTARRQMDAASRQAGLERQKIINEARSIEGRIRVLAQDPGSGMGGSVSSLVNQVAFDQAINQQIEASRYEANIAEIRSGYSAAASQVAQRYVSPVVAGIQGGLSGAMTGMALGDAFATPDAGGTFEPVGPPDAYPQSVPDAPFFLRR